MDSDWRVTSKIDTVSQMIRLLISAETVWTVWWCCVWLLQVWNYVRVYMLEALLDVYGHHMDNDWNNLVTRGFDEAQEKVSINN